MADPLTLFDTDVLIDAGRGVAIALDAVEETAGTRAISQVTQMELLVGCRNKAEMRALDQFLSHFLVVPLDSSISTEAVELLGRYRLSHGLLIPDALIAATALVLGIPLISKNQRDYRFIEGLDLVPYPETLSP